VTRHAAAPLDSLPSPGLLRVEIDGRALCLARVESGEVYAIDDVCTHEQASLSEGFLLGCEVECPLHNSRFDLATGEVRGFPATEDTVAYETHVGEDGVVYVDFP
jgi:3-phenylpropionate/trans-cinnamate dioxygenase ferredoxin subunit